MRIFFLNKEYFPVAASLSIVIASTGVLSVTYSPFMYTFYSYLGGLSVFFCSMWRCCPCYPH
ncbi:hypothetical protein ACFSQ7_44745 [Paenibacillus rhizoplanae]